MIGAIRHLRNPPKIETTTNREDWATRKAAFYVLLAIYNPALIPGGPIACKQFITRGWNIYTSTHDLLYPDLLVNASNSISCGICLLWTGPKNSVRRGKSIELLSIWAKNSFHVSAILPMIHRTTSSSSFKVDFDFSTSESSTTMFLFKSDSSEGSGCAGKGTRRLKVGSGGGIGGGLRTFVDAQVGSVGTGSTAGVARGGGVVAPILFHVIKNSSLPRWINSQSRWGSTGCDENWSYAVCKLI